MTRMKTTIHSNRGLAATSQWGVSLIEAMVAVLILAILFLGMAYVLSRGLVSQRYTNTQSIALLEMREGLQRTGKGVADLCSGATPDSFAIVDSIGVTRECSSISVDITVGALATVPISASSITIKTDKSASSANLFGGDGEILLSID